MSFELDGMPHVPPDPHYVGPLLRARLEWEAAHPRPESLRRAERAIVRALSAEGFGAQYQVTREDRFEIAVDDLLISVALQSGCWECGTSENRGDACAEHQEARDAVYREREQAASREERDVEPREGSTG